MLKEFELDSSKWKISINELIISINKYHPIKINDVDVPVLIGDLTLDSHKWKLFLKILISSYLTKTNTIDKGISVKCSDNFIEVMSFDSHTIMIHHDVFKEWIHNFVSIMEEFYGIEIQDSLLGSKGNK